MDLLHSSLTTLKLRVVPLITWRSVTETRQQVPYLRISAVLRIRHFVLYPLDRRCSSASALMEVLTTRDSVLFSKWQGIQKVISWFDNLLVTFMHYLLGDTFPD